MRPSTSCTSVMLKIIAMVPLLLLQMMNLSVLTTPKATAFVPQTTLNRIILPQSQSRIRSKSSSSPSSSSPPTRTIQSAAIAPPVPDQPSIPDVADALDNLFNSDPTVESKADRLNSTMPDLTEDAVNLEISTQKTTSEISATSSASSVDDDDKRSRRRKRDRIRKIPSSIKSKIPAWMKTKRSKSFILFSATSILLKLAFQAANTTPWQLAQQSYVKFINSWKTYTMIPFVAAFVGWITNYLAVQMIFYPIKWRGIPIIRKEGEPLGLLGWQGIIPAKTGKMSEAMVNVTINELLSMEETIQKLDPDEVATILAPEVPEMVKSVLEDDVASSKIPTPIRNLATTLIDNNNGIGNRILKDWLGVNFLKKLTVDMQNDILSVFNVRNCVVNQMMSDRSLLGKLFQKTGGEELSFLVDSGLWFGFILGVFQMLIALVCDNPWTLSTGGLIVGLLTNWIALKWIFEPIEPTKFGPFVLQGKFLRRQKEVAKDFSKFFATQILNSYEFWKSILYDPTTSPNFLALFTTNIIDITKQATKGLIGGKADVKNEYFNAAATKACQRLPYHFANSGKFYEYVDSTLGIETTLRQGLESMSSKQFEQILHPIFEEDELTLILAGGFLGFIAGFVQQLFATGVWSLPSLAMILSFFTKIIPFWPF